MISNFIFIIYKYFKFIAKTRFLIFKIGIIYKKFSNFIKLK